MQDTVKQRKKPTQARSQATVEAILEATTRILRQDGLAAVNTNRVAELAGVSVGSLYQYFPAREAILAELVRRLRLSMSGRLAAASHAMQNRPLAEAIPVMMAAAVHSYETEPRLTAALEEAEARLPRDPEIMAGRRAVKEAMIACLGRHGFAGPGEAAMDIIAMTRGIVMASIAAGRPDFASVRRRIEQAALGYLERCPRVDQSPSLA